MTSEDPISSFPIRRPLDNRIPPPVLAVVVAVLMVLASRASSSFALPKAAQLGVPVVLFLFAGVMGARAFAAFGRAGTTINPVNIGAASALVTSGVYRFSRNPMYVALTSLLTALAFALANVWAFTGPVVFAVFINRFQIIPEERIMRSKFGDAYASYAAGVRRWL